MMHQPRVIQLALPCQSLLLLDLALTPPLKVYVLETGRAGCLNGREGGAPIVAGLQTKRWWVWPC